MQRRSLLKLGGASALVLAAAGTGLAWVTPGLDAGRLADGGRRVFRACGRAILEGSLPDQPLEKELALDGLLQRVDGLVGALPPHLQKELSLLLSVLASGPGRQALAGLRTDWPDATVPQLQDALQSMRVSSLAMRQQAYHALHDIVGGAYFSDSRTWGQLGYPGPLKI